METTPAIVTYAPLIAASAIGLGIIVTMAILAGKIIFRLGGLSPRSATCPRKSAIYPSR